MTKKNQKYFIIIISFFLLASLAIACIPDAKAIETTNQQKAMSTLTDVIGFDLSKYNVTAKQFPTNQYQGVIPRESIGINLSTKDNHVDSIFTYVNGSLQMIYIQNCQGSPSVTTTQNVSTLQMAKDFLLKYKMQSKNPLYGELNSSLANVDATRNCSVVAENFRLNITALNYDLIFRWTRP